MFCLDFFQYSLHDQHWVRHFWSSLVFVVFLSSWIIHKSYWKIWTLGFTPICEVHADVIKVYANVIRSKVFSFKNQMLRNSTTYTTVQISGVRKKEKYISFQQISTMMRLINVSRVPNQQINLGHYISFLKDHVTEDWCKDAKKFSFVIVGINDILKSK